MRFIGSYLIGNNNLVIANKKTSYEIKGEDTKKFISVLPFLNGLLTKTSISKKTNISIEEIDAILDILNNMEVIDDSSIEKSILVVSDCFNREDLRILFEDNAFDNRLIFAGYPISTCTYKKDFDFILAISFYFNNTFFNEVDSLSNGLGVPWIKASVFGENFSLGPIFFTDGGPCYSCYSDNSKNNKSLSYSLNTSVNEILLLILKIEILKIINNDHPTKIFNSEFFYDVSNHEIHNEWFLQNPDCNHCRDKGVF